MNIRVWNSCLLALRRSARFSAIAVAVYVTLPIAFAQTGTEARALPDAPSPALGPGAPGSASVTASSTSLRSEPVDATPVALSGIRATLSLVSEVSSKLPTGSSFQARLEEPVTKDGQTVLPRGTVFEGHLKTVPARRPMRAGSVFMMFDRAILPGGTAEAVAANLLSTNSDAVKTDTEGEVRPTISKKRLVIQLGGTALTAKLADDLSQVIGGTAVSAGTARYAGFGAATTFFLIQKGREVKLKPGDELQVEFGR